MISRSQGLRVAFVTGLLLTLEPAARAEAPDDAALAIEETDAGFELTVPVSRLIIVIPKTGLTRGDGNGLASTESSRYFYFRDSSRGLVISGWFEPAHAFKGIQEFWADETAAWKRGGLPPARNTQIGKIGEWQTITYDIDAPSGNNSHIRAHLVRAGTWVDVHLSATAARSRDELRTSLEAVLNSISVSERP